MKKQIIAGMMLLVLTVSGCSAVSTAPTTINELAKETRAEAETKDTDSILSSESKETDAPVESKAPEETEKPESTATLETAASQPIAEEASKASKPAASVSSESKYDKIKSMRYTSDLTDAQWEMIKNYFPAGNKSKYEKRELVNAVLYLVKTGCQWRNLPKDFPNWKAVSMFYYRAQKKGIWDEILKMLVRKTRKTNGKNENPTYALIDSQSVKTVYNSEKRGFDGGKNERQKKTYSNRYYGKPPCRSRSCSKYP